MSLQEALKLLRLELCLTQEDLAKKLNMAFVTINRWENGKFFPSRANSRAILHLAKEMDASEECINYLREVLVPESKRPRSKLSYGFPDIDRDFLFMLADDSSNALYVIDAETYELIYLNKTAEKIATRNISPNELQEGQSYFATLKNKTCYYFFGKNDAPCVFCPVKEIGEREFIERIITAPEDGNKYHIRAKRAELYGRKVIVIYLTDVTGVIEERNALDELTTHANTGVAVYAAYLDSRIELLFMNSVYFKMIFSSRVKEITSSNFTDFDAVKPECKERLRALIKEAIKNKSSFDYSFDLFVTPGEYHNVTLHARPIKYYKDKVIYYCTFLDTEKNDSNKR